MKQVILSLAAILIAAMILMGMVYYSLSVIRAAQMRLLTGEQPGILSERAGELLT